MISDRHENLRSYRSACEKLGDRIHSEIYFHIRADEREAIQRRFRKL